MTFQSSRGRSRITRASPSAIAIAAILTAMAVPTFAYDVRDKLPVAGAPSSSDTAVKNHFLLRLNAPLQTPQAITDKLMIFQPRDGGTIDGPGLHGDIVSPAGDWVRIEPNGNMKIDVRLTIRMDNGDFVYMSYGGILKKPEPVSWRRFLDGEEIRAPEWYYVITPVFETASKKYGWLNNVQGVGKFASIQTGANAHVAFDIFAIE